MENLPPPIDTTPQLEPVQRPAGAPDADSPVVATPLAGPAFQAPPAPGQKAKRLSIRSLDFLDPARLTKEVPLDHGFRLDGIEVRTITVRRPLTAEVAAWQQDTAAGSADTFDLYAVMTGFPAEVLRGLVADDGAEVTAAAFDFLPRWLREGDASSPTSPSGEPTSRP